MNVMSISLSQRNNLSARVFSTGVKESLSARVLFLLLVVHPFLGLLMRAYPVVATLHALLVLTLGVFFALKRDGLRVCLTTAYLTGAEVLWRMSDARVFWEYGKYATIAILGLMLLQLPRWKRAGLPVLYFALLLPSIPATLFGLGWGEKARAAISFNLSGPLAMMVCILFFQQIRLTWQERKMLVWFLVAPLLGIVSIIVQTIRSVGVVSFANDSNFLTSGGFGPNQVSAVLGLGALLLILVFTGSRRNGERWLALGLAVPLAAFSALTFSRGGVYNLLGALLVAAPLLLANPRARNALLMLLAVVLIAGSFWLLPLFDSFTQGMFRVRFSDTDLTNRGEIALAQLAVWERYPFLGAGPGMAKYESLALLGFDVAAHTEYTRVLAEHGALGAFSLLCLLAMAVRAFRQPVTVWQKAWTVALLAWPLLEMSHAAMRIVAISFIFGLALAGWRTPHEVSRPDVPSHS